MSEFGKGAATVVGILLAIIGALYGWYCWGMSQMGKW